MRARGQSRHSPDTANRRDCGGSLRPRGRGCSFHRQACRPLGSFLGDVEKSAASSSSGGINRPRRTSLANRVPGSMVSWFSDRCPVPKLGPRVSRSCHGSGVWRAGVDRSELTRLKWACEFRGHPALPGSMSTARNCNSVSSSDSTPANADHPGAGQGREVRRFDRGWIRFQRNLDIGATPTNVPLPRATPRPEQAAWRRRAPAKEDRRQRLTAR